jgi:hypothetical protein
VISPLCVVAFVADKPAILQDERFTVEEGFAYRAARTGAIWMNKLFFSSLVLWGVWLLWGYARGESACVETALEGTHCNVFLHPTSLYLMAMAFVSFVLSIGFGVLGLIVGKRILQATPAAEEVGAARPPQP